MEENCIKINKLVHTSSRNIHIESRATRTSSQPEFHFHDYILLAHFLYYMLPNTIQFMLFCCCCFDVFILLSGAHEYINIRNLLIRHSKLLTR